jgi:hypothetical protein
MGNETCKGYQIKGCEIWMQNNVQFIPQISYFWPSKIWKSFSSKLRSLVPSSTGYLSRITWVLSTGLASRFEATTAPVCSRLVSITIDKCITQIILAISHFNNQCLVEYFIYNSQSNLAGKNPNGSSCMFVFQKYFASFGLLTVL